MINSDFLKNGLGIVSSPDLLYEFSRKMFSSYILLTDQISFPDCLTFLRYWLICVLQLFVKKVRNS